jgi:hypothetical protein
MLDRHPTNSNSKQHCSSISVSTRRNHGNDGAKCESELYDHITNRIDTQRQKAVHRLWEHGATVGGEHGATVEGDAVLPKCLLQTVRIDKRSAGAVSGTLASLFNTVCLYVYT